jgi:RND superfamily putative drug exporter
VTPAPARRPAARWALAIVRGRRWVLLGWAILALILVPLGRGIEERLAGASRAEDTEAAAASRILEEAFVGRSHDYAILAMPELSPRAEETSAFLGELAPRVAQVDGVLRVLSPRDLPDTLLVGHDGRGLLLVAEFDRAASPEAVLTGLRRATADAAALHPEVPLGTAAWTGELPLWVDMRRFSASDARRSEARALPATLLLLLLVFGSAVAAAIPLATGVVAIALALGVSGALADHLTLSVSLQNIVTILGLALGVDYSLLLVRRFREARADGASVEEAGVEATLWSGRTLALSGTAVIAGFLGLAWVPLNELRSVALGGVLVVAVAVALATTLVPAVLVTLGPRVEWGRIPGLGRPPGHGHRWRRWALWVIAHPWAVLAGGLALLAALSWPALRLHTAVSTPDTLPRVEAVRGLQSLGSMGRGGATLQLQVILELPAGTHVLSDSGWSAMARVARELESDPRIGRVHSLPGAFPAASVMPAMRAFLPDSLRSVFVDATGGRAYLEAVPAPGITTPDASRLVADLRGRIWEDVTGIDGARVRFAGTPAANLDYERLLGDALPRVIALVLATTMIALFVGFRSVLIPLKAVVLNLLSVGAAFGVLVLVFQEGTGAGLLGVYPSPDGVLPVIPVLVFCTVFGISMDYEVFLVARIREERRAGRDEVDAIAEGMQRTAGLITGAAAIMVVVFGAFALGDFVSTQMLGLALGTAVLVDASVVRLAVGPAILALGGRWNWWPGQ